MNNNLEGKAATFATSDAIHDTIRLAFSHGDTSPATPGELRTLAGEMEKTLIAHEHGFSHPDWRYIDGMRALADKIDGAAFCRIEDEIGKRGLGESYIDTLCGLVWPAADPSYESRDVWELVRAPLALKAKAALHVLAAAVPTGDSNG